MFTMAPAVRSSDGKTTPRHPYWFYGYRGYSWSFGGDTIGDSRVGNVNGASGTAGGTYRDYYAGSSQNSGSWGQGNNDAEPFDVRKYTTGEDATVDTFTLDGDANMECTVHWVTGGQYLRSSVHGEDITVSVECAGTEVMTVTATSVGIAAATGSGTYPFTASTITVVRKVHSQTTGSNFHFDKLTVFGAAVFRGRTGTYPEILDHDFVGGSTGGTQVSATTMVALGMGDLNGIRSNSNTEHKVLEYYCNGDGHKQPTAGITWLQYAWKRTGGSGSSGTWRWRIEVNGVEKNHTTVAAGAGDQTTRQTIVQEWNSIEDDSSIIAIYHGSNQSYGSGGYVTFYYQASASVRAMNVDMIS